MLEIKRNEACYNSTCPAFGYILMKIVRIITHYHLCSLPKFLTDNLLTNAANQCSRHHRLFTYGSFLWQFLIYWASAYWFHKFNPSLDGFTSICSSELHPTLHQGETSRGQLALWLAVDSRKVGTLKSAEARGSALQLKDMTFDPC